MFINFTKNLRDEMPRKSIVKQSTFIDHNGYIHIRKNNVYRVTPLTPKQVETFQRNLRKRMSNCEEDVSKVKKIGTKTKDSFYD